MMEVVGDNRPETYRKIRKKVRERRINIRPVHCPRQWVLKPPILVNKSQMSFPQACWPGWSADKNAESGNGGETGHGEAKVHVMVDAALQLEVCAEHRGPRDRGAGTVG